MSSIPERPPAAGVLADETGYVLMRLGEALQALTDQTIGPDGFRGRHLHIMRLADESPLSQQQLSDLTGLDRTTMVAAIDDLERLGFASRRRSATDRRKHIIVLTSRGRQALADAAPQVEEVKHRLFRHLDEDQRRVLHALATRLLTDARAELGHKPDPG